MKKIAVAICIILLTISLAGCGKSDEAKKADDLILGIGIVDKDSGKAIENAEFYYSMLSDKQRQQVEHYDYLVKAREEYDLLLATRYVPQLQGLSEEDALKTLDEEGIKYTVTYADTVTVPRGIVVSTTPDSGAVVDENTVVTVRVSNGPYSVNCENAIISWYNLGKREDDWQFYAPYIKRGETLIIDCVPTFGTNFEWKGSGFGEASLSESFDKSIPVTVEYSNQIVTAGEEQRIKLSVPITALEEERPTNIYFRLYILIEGKQDVLKVSFTMNW